MQVGSKSSKTRQYRRPILPGTGDRSSNCESSTGKFSRNLTGTGSVFDTFSAVGVLSKPVGI